jgi:hypothetical protein
MISRITLTGVIALVVFYVIQLCRKGLVLKASFSGRLVKERIESVSSEPQAMCDPYKLIEQKENEIQRVRKELDALRIVASLLEGSK